MSSGGEVCIKADVRNGIIKNVALTGDFLASGNPAEVVNNALSGHRFIEEEALQALKDVDMERYITGLTAEKIIKTLFKP